MNPFNQSKKKPSQYRYDDSNNYHYVSIQIPEGIKKLSPKEVIQLWCRRTRTSLDPRNFTFSLALLFPQMEIIRLYFGKNFKSQIIIIMK